MWFRSSIVMLALSLSPMASACTLASLHKGDTVGNWIEWAPIIFLGIPEYTAVEPGKPTMLESQRNPGIFSPNNRDTYTRFHILKNFKGTSGDTIDVAHPSGGAACGANFTANEPVLVYADVDIDGKVFTHSSAMYWAREFHDATLDFFRFSENIHTKP